MTTPWTKLEGTPIWIDAMMNYGDPRRVHHACCHPKEIYADAAALGIAYDSALDLAIMAHDVVIFSDTPERDSAIWLLETMKKHGIADAPYIVDGAIAGDDEDNILVAVDFIMSTDGHQIVEGKPCTLILLDIYNFTDPDRRRRATAANRREAWLAHDTPAEDFDVRCRAYLTGLKDRLERALGEGLGTGFVPELQKIVAGIGDALAELPDDHRPVP